MIIIGIQHEDDDDICIYKLISCVGAELWWGCLIIITIIMAQMTLIINITSQIMLFKYIIVIAEMTLIINITITDQIILILWLWSLILRFLLSLHNFDFSLNFQVSPWIFCQFDCICSSFTQCVFLNVSSKCLLEWMRNYSGCICWAFLRCVFSNVSSNVLFEKMHCHIGCTCLAFLHCAFSNVSSNRLPERMHNHIGCICLTFFHCVFYDASSRSLDHSI